MGTRRACFIAALLLAFCAPGAGAPASADSEQFCKAAGVVASVTNADTGSWLDRYTRNDGVEVICHIRTVHFRRFYKGPTNLTGATWKDVKKAEWNNLNCGDRVWRSAIEDGWIILAAITTAAGDKADFIATCK
jgi:hypothetical protein